MSTETLASNGPNVTHGLSFLREIVNARCEIQYGRGGEVKIPELAYYGDDSAFSKLVGRHQPSFDEYVILLLALLPHVAPGFLDKIVREALPAEGDFPEIGGRRGQDHRGLIPTGETAAFLLAGDDLERRFEVQRLFQEDHWFAQDAVLKLEGAASGEPILSGRVLLERDHVQLLTCGQVAPPAFSSDFPAKEIQTELEWEDVVLSEAVRTDVEEIQSWIKHNDTLLNKWGMRKKLKPGYRALFHGPPGSGKTLTASLLGKYTGRPVYSVVSSAVVSKFVGETSQNLTSLFERASSRGWILFFDECDALIGRRTPNVKDSHDKYANQEAATLLTLLESFDGLIIANSNLPPANFMDQALMRRFNKVVRFPFPAREERGAIWRKLLPKQTRAQDGTDVPEIFSEYELAGGGIINVVQHACLEALARNSDELSTTELHAGVRAEFEKEGRVFKQLDVG